MLGHNIFGGGLGDAADDAPEAQVNGSYADIKGNTTVKIDGGKWLWNQMADTQGNIIVWKDAPQVIVNDVSELRDMDALRFMGIISKYADSRFFNIDATTGKCNFVIAHNIFGGGKDACNVDGKATVTINHSPLSRLTDDEGNNINLLDEKTVGGLCWYASISNITNPQFSVFGGGWGINTRVAETDVYVGPGARFNATGEKLVLKPYGNDVADTNLRYDAVNEANNELFYFTIAAPGDLGKEPYAYITRTSRSMSYLRMTSLMISIRLVQRKESDCTVVPMVVILIPIHSCVIVQADWLCRSVLQPAHSWIFMVVVSADMSQAILRSLLTVSLLAVTYSVVVLALCLPIQRVTRPMVR